MKTMERHRIERSREPQDASWQMRGTPTWAHAETWQSEQCMAIEGLQQRSLQIALHEHHHLSIREWAFGGVRIRMVKGEFDETLVRTSAPDSNRVCLHFALHETSRSQFGEHMPIMFNSFEHNLLHLPSGAEQTEFAPCGTMARCSIEFSLDYFQQLLPDETPLLRGFRSALHKSAVASAHPVNLPMTPAMQAIIHELLSPQVRRGCLQKLYLESKVMELFVLHSEALQQGHSCNTCGLCVPVAQPTRSEQERLHEAHRIIQEHYALPPTLAELSRMVGLNEFALKRGFKSLFGTTVYGFVVERRMAIARELLLQNTMSIREIAEHVGYQHATHFTTAFKRHCGVLPGVYGKQSISQE